MSQGLVIGLLPDTWYTVNLQALNMAGMSQISETDFQLTLKMGKWHACSLTTVVVYWYSNET